MSADLKLDVIAALGAVLARELPEVGSEREFIALVAAAADLLGVARPSDTALAPCVGIDRSGFCRTRGGADARLRAALRHLLGAYAATSDPSGDMDDGARSA